MKDREKTLSLLTNLILEKGTRDWEREQLVQAKTSEDFNHLEWILRPHALRGSLSPGMTEFYQYLITGQEPSVHGIRKEELGMTEERGIFAGGCFWCMVQPFEETKGILSVVSGYTGGHVDHPTYEEVVSHTTGHTEAVEIIFDRNQISYQELVELYWQQTDPTDAFGQFQDRGDNYRPVIFYTSEEQKAIATASKEALQVSERFLDPIVTSIEPAQTFWPAENYHQRFYKTNPERYAASASLRHKFLKKNWSKSVDSPSTLNKGEESRT